MKRIAILLALAALGGCAASGPLGQGTQVRAIMASQIVAPQPHANTGSDGAAAVAAQANYQRSYTTPTPQGDSPTFGNK